MTVRFEAIELSDITAGIAERLASVRRVALPFLCRRASH